VFSRRRSLVAMVAAALLTGLGVAATAAPAQADAAGWRSMRNAGNGKCIDNALENALKVQIWSCVNGNPNDSLPEGMEQMWTIDNGFDEFGRPAYRIRNRLSGRCIGGITDFVPIRVIGDSCIPQYDNWQVLYENRNANGWYQVLQSTISGLCLNLQNNSSANGTILEQDYCDRSFTNPAQQWTLGVDLPFPGGVTVPHVVGYDQQSAVSIVANAGLAVSVGFNNNCAAPGDVEVESPPGGSIMSPGTTVRLSVSTCDGGGIPK
jgi:hypothetical protein